MKTVVDSGNFKSESSTELNINEGLIMNHLDSKIIDMIRKTCKGKTQIKLTVGALSGEDIDIQVFNELGEVTKKQIYTYEIGSITKTFTASLFSKFLFENKMSLDDSIGSYITELESMRYYPTLRRLATHTSGYASRYPLSTWEFIKMTKDIFFGGETQKINPVQINFNKMKLLMQNSKLDDMDYKWNYSNFGMSVLGYALGSVSTHGYWDTMNDFVSKELGLHHTYLGTIKNKNLCGFNAKNEECENWEWHKSNLMAPASALSSTAEDLLGFAKLNMYEEKPYLPLCHKKYADGTKKHDMGLSWWLSKENNNMITHSGGTGCFSSFLAVDKSKKIAIVVLANYRLGIDLGQTIGYAMLKRLQKVNTRI